MDNTKICDLRKVPLIYLTKFRGQRREVPRRKVGICTGGVFEDRVQRRSTSTKGTLRIERLEAVDGQGRRDGIAGM